MAPYHVIGSKHPSGGGGGGGAPPLANSRWLFYHTDHLGSPRVITDVSGNVVSQHHFMPFGDEKPIPARASSNTMMFTGHERDTESASSDNPDGLDYMMARHYSSSLGRFMAVDPDDRGVRREDPQSWNRYTYVRNNPLNSIDPDGRKDSRSERDKQVLEDSDVKEQTQEAWKDSNPDAKKDDRQEVGFGTTEVAPGDFDTTGLQTQSNPIKVEMEVPKDSAGTVHTHPVGNGFVKDPESGKQVGVRKKLGEGDQKLARETNAPAYVVTKNKMYRVDPHTGDVKVILSGKDFRGYMGQEK